MQYQKGKLMPVLSFRSSRVLLGFFFLTTCCAFSQIIRPINEKGLDSLISNRNGNILVLNFWATWCGPCKEEFPDLVKISSYFKKRNADFAAISVDDPDEIESDITPFIKKMNARFPVFVSDIGSQDTLINKIDSDWSGGIPATFIYDATGKHRKLLFGLQRYDQLKKAIEDVLSKP